MNISSKKFGLQETINWYDEHASEYATKVDHIFNVDVYTAFTNKIIPKARILDLGCGSGRDAKHFFEDGYEVVGIDISQGLLNIAQKKNPDITFIKGSFLQLPFEDNTFDGIWAYASLVHLETTKDVLKALTECRRVLKPNGVMIVYVKQQLNTQKTSVVSDTLSDHDRFFRLYTATELKQYFKQTGFDIISIKQNQKDSAGRNDVRWLLALVH